MTPIEMLDKQLLIISDKILCEQEIVELYNMQLYEAKLRLQYLEADKLEFETVLIKLKGK